MGGNNAHIPFLTINTCVTHYSYCMFQIRNPNVRKLKVISLDCIAHSEKVKKLRMGKLSSSVTPFCIYQVGNSTDINWLHSKVIHLCA